MKKVRICFVGIMVAVMCLGILSSFSEAQTKFPSRPIQFICPWGAGGGTDRVARMLAVLLEKDLGQPVTVVNRTGGGGAVGHTAGSTAAPDGHTITIVTVEIIMMHWMGLAKVTYSDFKPVGLVNVDSAGVNVKADAPWKTHQRITGLCQGQSWKIEGLWNGKRRHLGSRPGRNAEGGGNFGGCYSMGSERRSRSRVCRSWWRVAFRS